MSPEPKLSNKPQENQLPMDPEVMFLYTVIFIAIIWLIWYFGFRNPTSDIPVITLTNTSVTAEVPEEYLTSGYSNLLGRYALNYPSDWQGTEDSSNLQFQLSEGAMIYVYVDDQTIDYSVFKANSELFSVIVNEVNTEIGGVSAQCVELSQPESQTISAIACFIPKNGKGYIISAAELDGLSDADRKIVQREFMDLLLSFRFME